MTIPFPAHATLTATALYSCDDGRTRYAIRPSGKTGSSGFSPFPWDAQYVWADSEFDALSQAIRQGPDGVGEAAGASAASTLYSVHLGLSPSHFTGTLVECLEWLAREEDGATLAAVLKCGWRIEPAGAHSR